MSAAATRGTASAIAVIPARFASVRFPGKLLADRTGWPLVRHVWERVRTARLVSRVLVATDDERIADAVRAFGGDVRMTRGDHVNGTTRVAEAIEGVAEELVINVQGDEPEIDPDAVDRVATLLAERPDCPMATLAAPLTDAEDPEDPNIVKVVLALDGTAVTFSRSAIPFDRDAGRAGACLRHIGLYGYRRSFLPRYVGLPATPLEHLERLEQLRAIEHRIPIAVAIVEGGGHGVDTEAQYEAFVRRWNGDRPQRRPR